MIGETMALYSFDVGTRYKREQVSEIVGDGGVTTGNWSTGYPQKNGATFIFCNVGNAGQTGHDYDNRFDGQDLVWRGRTGSKNGHSSIQQMTSPDAEVHVFWRSGGRDPFTYAGLATAVDISDEIPVRIRWKLSQASAVPSPSQTTRRLAASTLNKVGPEHIWKAVQLLLQGHSDHPFADSTDYDVLAGNGHRLPPKAVFGVAAALALGYEVLPGHFTAGLLSPCFLAIAQAGFPVVPKQQPEEILPILGIEDQQWVEGKEKLVSHLRRERSRGASQAKRSQFKQQFGKLYCEKCGLDPVEHYGTIHAESCIEVHHKTVQVHEMDSYHLTTLDSLQCLCANCHRLEHRILKSIDA
jgi:hypothetical protein